MTEEHSENKFVPAGTRLAIEATRIQPCCNIRNCMLAKILPPPVTGSGFNLSNNQEKGEIPQHKIYKNHKVVATLASNTEKQRGIKIAKLVCLRAVIHKYTCSQMTGNE